MLLVNNYFIEKDYSKYTIRGYSLDLASFEGFLITYKCLIRLDDLLPSTCRRFIKDQVLTYGINPHTLQRRISCLVNSV